MGYLREVSVRKVRVIMYKTMIIVYRNRKYTVKLWPDNDGRFWYYHPKTGEVVFVE